MSRKVLLPLSCLIILINQAITLNAIQINKGELDLRYVNLQKSESIRLQGEVEFYWNQLLTPEDLNNPTIQKKLNYITIPKSWTSLKINNAKLPNKGYATYRFVILKNPDAETKFYGLKFASVFSSYKLWVNGKLLSEVGKVGINRTNSKPAFKYADIPFVLDPALGSTEKIEVVIQVSNFSHQRSGLAFPIYFGTHQNLINETRWNDIINLIIIGLILVIGINHLSLYFLRRQDISNLYFGIVCLVMILRNISTADRIITYFIPNMGWEFLIKLDNFSGFGTIPLFALFIYSLFKEDFPKLLKEIFVAIGVLISIFVFVTPAIIYGKFRMFFEIYILIGGLYLTFGILLIAALKKRPYALPTFIGMFILYATAINDVLSSMGVIQTAYVAPYGLAAFMLFQSITINRKSAAAINENENLSAQLSQEKESLEIKINERTKELQIEHQELLKHQEKDQEQNWLNVGVAKTNEVLSKSKENLKTLTKNTLKHLLNYVNAKMGVIYIINKDDENNPYLEMISDYGCSKEMKKNSGKIPPDHGLVGACFSDNKYRLLTEIPDNFIKINSGLGESAPRNLLLVPLSYEKNVLGVVEIASFNELKPIEIEFINRIAETLGNYINTAKMNEDNIKLIENFRKQTIEMQEKEQRMVQSLEEMAYFREQYERMKSKYEMEN